MSNIWIAYYIQLSTNLVLTKLDWYDID